jgi:hypothetical protein
MPRRKALKKHGRPASSFGVGRKIKAADVVRYAVVAVFILVAGYLAYDTWVTNQALQGASAVGQNDSAYSTADVSKPP